MLIENDGIKAKGKPVNKSYVDNLKRLYIEYREKLNEAFS